MSNRKKKIAKIFGSASAYFILGLMATSLIMIPTPFFPSNFTSRSGFFIALGFISFLFLGLFISNRIVIQNSTPNELEKLPLEVKKQSIRHYLIMAVLFIVIFWFIGLKSFYVAFTQAFGDSYQSYLLVPEKGEIRTNLGQRSFRSHAVVHTPQLKALDSRLILPDKIYQALPQTNAAISVKGRKSIFGRTINEYEEIANPIKARQIYVFKDYLVDEWTKN